MGVVVATQIHVSLPPGLDPGEMQYIEQCVRQAAENAIRQLEEDRNKQVTALEEEHGIDLAELAPW